MAVCKVHALVQAVALRGTLGKIGPERPAPNVWCRAVQESGVKSVSAYVRLTVFLLRVTRTALGSRGGFSLEQASANPELMGCMAVNLTEARCSAQSQIETHDRAELRS